MATLQDSLQHQVPVDVTAQTGSLGTTAGYVLLAGMHTPSLCCKQQHRLFVHCATSCCLTASYTL